MQLNTGYTVMIPELINASYKVQQCFEVILNVKRRQLTTSFAEYSFCTVSCAMFDYLVTP